MTDHRILLLSAYDAVSHRRWRQGLVAAFPEVAWTVLTLPPRHFRWRIRGNSLSWAFAEREALEAGYDLVVATSMVDLAGLRGLVPALAATPTLAYFHENQFAYPESGHAHPSHDHRLVNLYTALAAETVRFNSAFNRDTFRTGARELLARMPDAVPPALRQAVDGVGEVLPVPLDPAWFRPDGAPADGPLTLVWPHRWEHDKAPERFVAALERLVARGVDFRVHLLGQQFRDSPVDVAALVQRLGNRVGRVGPMADDDAFGDLLQASHVVVSTALHDFQGLAVQEAVAAGCRPVVPDRLAYRDFIPAAWRYPDHAEDPAAEADALADRLEALAAAHGRGELPPAPDLAWLSWLEQRPAWGQALGVD
ncbi:DUF3524 domain-containing protein [Thiohalospira sp.]|uniref:tRNA-queuosine alpha-mannosyltransferase domain-containing protein n=1 Tax=Thiohalospira sp. TaxID=3080549 RepID=UPI00397F06F9